MWNTSRVGIAWCNIYTWNWI